jgi:hypothetical protein
LPEVGCEKGLGGETPVPREDEIFLLVMMGI